MSEAEREALKDWLARNPDAGDPIVGTGGCRKVRLARSGTGRSGGYRAFTFFTGSQLPLFLLSVYTKAQKDNLSHVERNALRAVTTQLEGYGLARRRW